MRMLGWALIQSDRYPYKKRKFGHAETQGVCTWRKDLVRPQREKVCKNTARRWLSRDQEDRTQQKPALTAL